MEASRRMSAGMGHGDAVMRQDLLSGFQHESLMNEPSDVGDGMGVVESHDMRKRVRGPFGHTKEDPEQTRSSLHSTTRQIPISGHSQGAASGLMPAAAMWAVAPAGGLSSSGPLPGAFWMLPVSAGSSSPGIVAGPSEQIWTFPPAGPSGSMYRMAAPPTTSIHLGTGGNTTTSSSNTMMPLSASVLSSGVAFMPRLNLTGGLGLDLQSGQFGHMPLGPMLLHQGSQQQSLTGLGLGGEQQHLGMLAALSTYSGRSRHTDHQPMSGSSHHHHGENGENPTNSH
eukprot:c24563_g1_i2 orf=729-1577(-)